MSTVPPNLGAFGVVVPDDWTLELLPRQPDHVLLCAPSGCCVATIDFRARGIRVGYNTASSFLGDKHRKRYVGRGWRQTLVDDAIVYLREMLGVQCSSTAIIASC